MARWAKGEQVVQFLVDRKRLESFAGEDLAALAEPLIGRAVFRMAAEALLARQALRATGGVSARSPRAHAEFTTCAPSEVFPVPADPLTISVDPRYFGPTEPSVTLVSAALSIRLPFPQAGRHFPDPCRACRAKCQKHLHCVRKAVKPLVAICRVLCVIPHGELENAAWA